MDTLLSKLDNLLRFAKAHAPAATHGLVKPLETAYLSWRDKQRAKAVASDESAGEPDEEPAPIPRVINWEQRSQADLVDHIEQHYHAGLRRDLPMLIDAAQKLEREHQSHASVPNGLSDQLAEFFSMLDDHMTKEERMLFPTLRTGVRGGGSEIGMPMRMMEREHDDHANGLEKIRSLTRNLSAPSDATPAWKQLYVGLETLESELRQHIYLENNILFARASGGGGDDF